MAIASAGRSATREWRAARRRRRDVLGGSVVALAAMGAFFVLWFGRKPGLAVVLVAGLAAPGAVMRAWYRRSSLADPDRWLRGADGERRTAALLDQLPRRRWSVWHDLPVPGSRANIDHLAVGPTGLWVVDSKSTRTTVRAGWRTVRFGERRLDVAPLRWETERLAETIDASGLGLAVRPVVAVHGRWTGGRRKVRVAGVPVVPADRLVYLMARRPKWRRVGRRRVAEAANRIHEAFGDRDG